MASFDLSAGNPYLIHATIAWKSTGLLTHTHTHLNALPRTRWFVKSSFVEQVTSPIWSVPCDLETLEDSERISAPPFVGYSGLRAWKHGLSPNVS